MPSLNASNFSNITAQSWLEFNLKDFCRQIIVQDVLQKATNKWFRTSDDEAPVEIEQSDLTKRGYIFLYKKIDQ